MQKKNEEKEHEWFFFTFDLINNMELFPFHLFMYNPGKKKGSLVVSANSPLTDDKKAMVLKFVKLGGIPAIKSNQKLTFMNFLELPEKEQKRLDTLNKFILKRIQNIEEEVEDSGENPLNELDCAMEENQEMFEEEPPEYDETPKKRIDSLASKVMKLAHPYSDDGYLQGLRNLFSENFPPLIKELFDDINSFEIPESNMQENHEAKTIQIAKVLAKQFLSVDNVDTRVCAVAHLFAKKYQISNHLILSKIFISAILRNIGLTCISRGIIKTRSHEDSQYEKHSLMSSNLINMTRIDLPEDVCNLIEESHSIGGGFGYPTVRNPSSMDPAESSFFFASFLIESCYSYPKSRIGNIKKEFQEFQKTPKKTKNIFGHKIELLFNSDQSGEVQTNDANSKTESSKPQFLAAS